VDEAKDNVLGSVSTFGMGKCCTDAHCSNKRVDKPKIDYTIDITETVKKIGHLPKFVNYKAINITKQTTADFKIDHVFIEKVLPGKDTFRLHGDLTTDKVLGTRLQPPNNSLPALVAAPTWYHDIAPLFDATSIAHMVDPADIPVERFTNLDQYTNAKGQGVKDKKDLIYEYLKAGIMPPWYPWPDADVALFKNWIGNSYIVFKFFEPSPFRYWCSAWTTEYRKD